MSKPFLPFPSLPPPLPRFLLSAPLYFHSSLPPALGAGVSSRLHRAVGFGSFESPADRSNRSLRKPAGNLT
eukprot:749300-Hanusia_phi.AAC.3